jgi:hypothetical protein
VTLEWVKSRHVHHLMNLATEMARWPVILRTAALQARDNERPHRTKNLLTALDRNRYQRKAPSRCSRSFWSKVASSSFFRRAIRTSTRTTLRKPILRSYFPFNSIRLCRHRGSRRKTCRSQGANNPDWTAIQERASVDGTVEHWQGCVHGQLSRRHLVRYLETQVAELSRLSENYRISNRTMG